jgi:hypothetical protein
VFLLLTNTRDCLSKQKHRARPPDTKRSHDTTEYRLVTSAAGIGRWLWIDLFDKMSHALEMKQKSSSGGSGDLSISNVALKRMHSMQARASTFTKQAVNDSD